MRNRTFVALAFTAALLIAGSASSSYGTTLTDQSGKTYAGKITSIFQGKLTFDLSAGGQASIEESTLNAASTKDVKEWAKHNPDKVDVYTRVDVNPLPTRTKAPVIPYELRESGAHGLVAISCVVDKKGNVIHPTVLKSSMQELEQPAVQAVAQWKFRPAKKNGKPVKVRIIIPIKFS